MSKLRHQLRVHCKTYSIRGWCQAEYLKEKIELDIKKVMQIETDKIFKQLFCNDEKAYTQYITHNFHTNALRRSDHISFNFEYLQIYSTRLRIAVKPLTLYLTVLVL